MCYGDKHELQKHSSKMGKQNKGFNCVFSMQTIHMKKMK
jgi:hypothetical protein